jgi:hypothetical protein
MKKQFKARKLNRSLLEPLLKPANTPGQSAKKRAAAKPVGTRSPDEALHNAFGGAHAAHRGRSSSSQPSVRDSAGSSVGSSEQRGSDASVRSVNRQCLFDEHGRSSTTPGRKPPTRACTPDFETDKRASLRSLSSTSVGSQSCALDRRTAAVDESIYRQPST